MHWEIMKTGNWFTNTSVKGMKLIMKIRTLAMTLILTLTIWIFAAPILTGCGSQISDSNTNSVENVRRDTSGESGEATEAAEKTAEQMTEQTSEAYASMSEIKKAVVEILGKNYWPDRQLTKEELETETGITEEMYEDYLAEMQNVETDIDTMIIIKAEKDRLTEIETMLNEYRESLMVKYKERPRELGKVEASRIEIIDSYICFVQLGADTKSAAEAGDEQVIAQCQQENERAVDMIEKTILDQ